MLNINQNFDLKAPVFNFDRDYFNSVDELNAYDTSNVPDHFVTNVAGMLYQFTDGEWLPMIGITKDGANNNSQLYLLSNQLSQWDESSCYISKDANGLNNFRIGSGYKYSELLSDCALNLVKNSNGNSGDYSRSSIQLNAYDTSAAEEHYSAVNIKLLEHDSNTVNISPGDGFCHDVWMAGVRFGALKCSANGMSMYVQDDVVFNIEPTQDGSIISGIKSLTACTDPSATKVWATDGSTVDLSTKANTSDLDAKANKSDVLLKKSESGGYYIEGFMTGLGNKAFAANKYCAARSDYSHAEGNFTRANATCSHAEGANTTASGYTAHAQGTYNIDNINAIHSVGIGDDTTRKNAEYIYTKNNTNSTSLVDDPKNGYKYLIGVGGYDGISTDNTTYKSVQEVIADLTARIEQLETKVKALEDANTPA